MSTSNPSTAQWVSFTHRYGLNRYGGDEWPHWSRRHARHPVSGRCCSDEKKVCVCPGIPGRPPCCVQASQEDRLCDDCREWCWGVLGHSNTRVRFVDTYGGACA